MQWARYGSEKKQISAEYYREAKHGDVICRFCEGKMTFVATGNRTPHFRVVDRKTHTCKYFGMEIDELVSACSSSVRMDRKNNESPVFTLNIDSTKGLERASEDSLVPSLTSHNIKQSLKERALYKFIHDIYYRFLKNEYDKILQFRFVVEEGGQIKKVKADELLPNYKQIFNLNERGKLSDRKRFIVGTILYAKETLKQNIEVTLRGEKSPDGSYINHKVIFMKYGLEQQNLHISDFYKGRTIVVYSKLKISDTKREIISFVSNKGDFDFGLYTSLDGDWLDSLDKTLIDDFFYLGNIIHAVPDQASAKHFFYYEDQVYKPDWILFIQGKIIVVDYADSPNDFINGPLELRRDYFINHTDYHYIAIYKEDFESNYKGLKRKIHEIAPNLQLNFYES